ncbi:MAG TPA: TatD family hydrolase [Opitutus sp.]|nr:TatD family hydrolase [Opitutus sp.]
MLIDTHTHLEGFARTGALDGVLARARAAGVEAMITIGTSPDDWEMNREIVRANPGFVFHAVGLHPCEVDDRWNKTIGKIDGFWTNAAAGQRPALPVALGECGLDRFHLPKDHAEAERVFAWQKGAFAAQLEIAKRLGCPVVVHSRGAFRECVEMIDAGGVDWAKVVFHCFAEGEAEMAELMRRGGVGSFTGIITYKSAENVRAAARTLGLERMMVETDAPYLTPVPHRGKPNEPAFVRHTAEFCAKEVFGVSDEEFARATTANARRFFGL